MHKKIYIRLVQKDGEHSRSKQIVFAWLRMWPRQIIACCCVRVVLVLLLLVFFFLFARPIWINLQSIRCIIVVTTTTTKKKSRLIQNHAFLFWFFCCMLFYFRSDAPWQLQCHNFSLGFFFCFFRCDFNCFAFHWDFFFTINMSCDCEIAEKAEGKIAVALSKLFGGSCNNDQAY